jgi:hypothetical protein
MNEKRLPVLRIIKHAFSISWEKKLYLLRTLIVPYFLLISLGSIQPYMGSKLRILTGFSTMILSSLVYAVFVVSCHRLILLGDSSIPRFGIIIPGKREIRFWGWTIGLSILAAIILGVPMLIIFLLNFIPKKIVIILFSILGFYLFARWSLIFPAVAVDKRPYLQWPWIQSRGNGLRIFIIFIIPSLPIYSMNYFIKNESFLLLNGAVLFLTFVFTVIGIILISLSYKELCMQSDNNKNNQEIAIC